MNAPLPSLTVPQLIENAALNALLKAVRDEFATLLPSCAVSIHPGKLDISDVIGGEVGTLPAVKIGWTQVKAAPEVARDFALQADLIAYIAVSEFADLENRRRVPREEVGQAIGLHLLSAIHSDAHALWGLTGIDFPARTPAPQLKPVFTATSYSKGVAYYAVTWSQDIPGQGGAIATGPEVTFSDEDGALIADNEDVVEADAIAALFRQVEEEGA